MNVVAMNGCKIEFGTKTEGGAVTYRAPKGERFVFLLLGSTPIDGSAPLDPDDVLKELGWSPTSPEMGEISREIARVAVGHFVKVIRACGPGGSPGALASTIERNTETQIDAILSKLKENGLSREGLGGLAQSQPGSDAQERSPVPPLSDGGE